MDVVQPVPPPHPAIERVHYGPKAIAVSLGTSLLAAFGSTAAAVILHLAWVGSAGFGLLAGMIYFLFADKRLRYKPIRRLGAAFILTTIVLALPWVLLYLGATYVLSERLLTYAFDVCLAGFAFMWIRGMLGGWRSIRAAKFAEQSQAS